MQERNLWEGPLSTLYGCRETLTATAAPDPEPILPLWRNLVFRINVWPEHGSENGG